MHGSDNLLQLSAYKKQLRVALEPFVETHRIAFAAWCCERLFPWYHALATFVGLNEVRVLRMVVDEVWKCSTLSGIDHRQLAELQEQCELLEFGDEGCSIFRKPAMDSVGAAMLALDVCKEPTADAVTKVGQCVIDMVDGQIMAVVWEMYNRPMNPDDLATIEKQMAIHPTMLSELWRQSQVILLLQRTSKVSQETVRQLVELAN